MQGVCLLLSLSCKTTQYICFMDATITIRLDKATKTKLEKPAK